jgi:pyruvate carboxylase
MEFHLLGHPFDWNGSEDVGLLSDSTREKNIGAFIECNPRIMAEHAVKRRFAKIAQLP